jgi:phosphopantothenoylcysteine decarboxylase/phosphopantothenate--cysteine ligase
VIDPLLRSVTALVTGGPTYEPIDPVRFIGNRARGKQGQAIAAALAAMDARTTLVMGPTTLPDVDGVVNVHVETAREMLAACRAHLPVTVLVCTAAVADWRVDEESTSKLKKDGHGPPVLRLVENPDILHTLSLPGPDRPRLCVGFAAETEDVVERAAAKRERKGCDWILANDVSPANAVPGVFGGDWNRVTLITPSGVEPWPVMTKVEIARRLAAMIASHLDERVPHTQPG